MHGLWALILSVMLSFSDAGKRKTGEVKYDLNFIETVKECDDFKNEVVIMDLFLQDDTPTNTSLFGNIVISETLGVDGNLEVVVRAYKEGHLGPELFHMISGNVCENMRDINSPWATLFIAMDTESCPIEAKTYPISDLKLNLNYAGNALVHEFTGDYTVSISIVRPGNVASEIISCYVMGVSVAETKVEDGQH